MTNIKNRLLEMPIERLRKILFDLYFPDTRGTALAELALTTDPSVKGVPYISKPLLFPLIANIVSYIQEQKNPDFLRPPVEDKYFERLSQQMKGHSILATIVYEICQEFIEKSTPDKISKTLYLLRDSCQHKRVYGGLCTIGFNGTEANALIKDNFYISYIHQLLKHLRESTSSQVKDTPSKALTSNPFADLGSRLG